MDSFSSESDLESLSLSETIIKKSSHQSGSISIFDYGMSCSQSGHYNMYNQQCLDRDTRKINEFINNRP